MSNNPFVQTPIDPSAAFGKSVISFPDRGPWGKSEWRGNTSGHVIRGLIATYGIADLVVDPMEGSGTTGDVCHQWDIPYLGFDLKDRPPLNPSRNILNPSHQADMQRRVRAADSRGAQMVFLHPPYWNMITYSNDPHDLSGGTYQQFITRMGAVLKFASSITRPGGIVALQIGDLRRGNQTWFMGDDTSAPALVTPARLIKEFRFIKVQHNTVSGGDVGYVSALVHEYLTIFRKP
ncbi:MAG: site-specific DNA-methyltransferase [Porticoccaceae bacterium]|nr:site-specific DNA-methyltransferase [Porticoccaceae bacterium]